MKKIYAFILATMLMLSTCACSGDVDDIKSKVSTGQQVISQYAQAIEDNKEGIQEGLGKLQGIADEALQQIRDTD